MIHEDSPPSRIGILPDDLLSKIFHEAVYGLDIVRIQEKLVPTRSARLDVSHVSKRWRGVALETASLWTTIAFTTRSPIEKAEEWIRRTKSALLDITIMPYIVWEDKLKGLEPFADYDALLATVADPVEREMMMEAKAENIVGAPEADYLRRRLRQILDLVLSRTSCIGRLHLSTDVVWPLRYILIRILSCEIFPELRKLGLTTSSWTDRSLEIESLLNPTRVPKLKELKLHGIRFPPAISNLRSLAKLAVRPVSPQAELTYEDINAALTSSPNLKSLALAVPGLSSYLPPGEGLQDLKWHSRVIALPQLVHLSFGDSCESVGASFALWRLLCTPSLKALSLAVGSSMRPEDWAVALRYLYTPIQYPTHVLSQCQAPSNPPYNILLAQLKHLEINSWPDIPLQTMAPVLVCFVSVKSLTINFMNSLNAVLRWLLASHRAQDEKNAEVTEILQGGEPITNTFTLPFPVETGKEHAFLPALECLTAWSISGEELKTIIERRVQLGSPLQQLYIGGRVDANVEWLVQNVKAVKRFTQRPPRWEEDY